MVSEKIGIIDDQADADDDEAYRNGAIHDPDEPIITELPCHSYFLLFDLALPPTTLKRAAIAPIIRHPTRYLPTFFGSARRAKNYAFESPWGAHGAADTERGGAVWFQLNTDAAQTCSRPLPCGLRR